MLPRSYADCPLTKDSGQNFSVMSNYIQSHPATKLNEAFFEPMNRAVQVARHQRVCNKITDQQFCEFGVRRVLENEISGRAYLENLADHHDKDLKRSSYFSSLASDRRLELVCSVNEHLREDVRNSTVDDPFVGVESLANFDIYAGDGHYIRNAVHDKPIDGTTYATGNFFCLNLRTHHLAHLLGSDRSNNRKKEHDMRALKRMTYQVLRQGAKIGRQVIWAWDRASIDIDFWHTCKSRAGIYFVSMAKENMHLQRSSEMAWDRDDPLNAGVTDCAKVFAGKKTVTCVWYTCPIAKKSYTFISTLSTVEPGVIAAIYKARWDIEKTFDETKKKLQEDKSWATSDTAKDCHAQMCCLAHNLLLLCERRINAESGVHDQSEVKRRRHRFSSALGPGDRMNYNACSSLVERICIRASQRALKFIRLIRNHMRTDRLFDETIAALARRYRRC